MPYLLFTGLDYYPSGGARDLKGRFETIEQAVDEHLKGANDPSGCSNHDCGWANILDLDTLKIVRSCDNGKWRDVAYSPFATRLTPPPSTVS